MKIIEKTNKKFITKSVSGEINGYLIPIYNINEEFFPKGEEPQQVYLTAIGGHQVKGPHLHYIRTGCFTCIKGNARFILKTDEGYKTIYSGENYYYRTVIVPTGIPAALQNLGDEEALIINMPQPAWTPEMNDEYTADFSDFDFGI